MPSTTPLMMFSMRWGMVSRMAGFRLRQVPSSFTSSVMML